MPLCSVFEEAVAAMPVSAVPSSSEVFQRMLACARARGIADAGVGCTPGVCGESRPVPVQLWVHKSTKECRHAWLWEKPEWTKGEYTVVKRFNCFFSCRKFHLHHCCTAACDSLERGHVVESANGDMVCAMSGRVLEVTTTFDWRERKKGSYTMRRARRPDPACACGNSAAGVQHNIKDWKLVQTSVNVVFDSLFSKLRQELYANARRNKKRVLESRVMQYAKRCKREGKFAYISNFNRIAIESGFFSSCNYENVVRAQDSRTTMRELAPLLVSLFRNLNAMTPTPTFKCFPAFGIACLYNFIRGTSCHGVQVLPRVNNIVYLLPHPNTIEGYFRFLWSFYDNAAPVQRSFLTRTKNAIKATLRGLPDADAARAFKHNTQTLAEALKHKYYELVEKHVDSL